MSNSDERFNPEMLVQARLSRELTQGELAKRVETTQGRISKVEHGLQVPARELVQQLAEVLDYPAQLFYESTRLPGPPLRFHRKRQSVSKKKLDRIHAEIILRSLEVARLVRSVDIEPEYELPEIDVDEMGGDPEAVARAVRVAWHLPNGPIRNVVETLERAGIIIVLTDFGGVAVDGIGFRPWPTTPPMLFINSTIPTDRMRFTLMHETAHLVMHRIPNTQMEDEAQRFAAEFLMPASEIRPELRGVTLPALASLKPIWRVAMSALLYRAQTLGVVGKKRASTLWREMSYHGYNRNEPVELEPEEPTLLARIVDYHRDDLGYALDELAFGVVKLLPAEFQRIYIPRRLRLVS